MQECLLYLKIKLLQLDSYKDWFSHDWSDRIRDYEWDPNANKIRDNLKFDLPYVDSVPLRYAS